MAQGSTRRGRFAPSMTGVAHPGTLLAGLFCWLDARSAGGHVLLRLEDLDTTRLRPGFCESMLAAMRWLGLEFDDVQRQSELAEQHVRALDALEAQGRLYPCGCSRSELRASGRRAPDGGFAYDNRCRARELPAGGWRECQEPLRIRLPDIAVSLVDELGNDLSQTPARDMGDPIAVRRDGAVAYHLAVVADDSSAGINRVVRGRDLAPSTATQILLYDLLQQPVPSYAHHFLLLEERGGKLAKLHGSIGFDVLQESFTAAAFCGRLAQMGGLRPSALPCTPQDLLGDFSWERVRREDLVFSL